MQGTLFHPGRRKGSSRTLVGWEASLSPDEGVGEPYSRSLGTDATHQERLPNLESAPLPPFLVNETHHVPYGYLRRPVRRPTVSLRIPDDHNSKVLHVSWRIEGLRWCKQSISCKAGSKKTCIELRFNFVHRSLLLLDNVFPYGPREPPSVFRRHTGEHVESFGL